MQFRMCDCLNEGFIVTIQVQKSGVRTKSAYNIGPYKQVQKRILDFLTELLPSGVFLIVHNIAQVKDLRIFHYSFFHLVHLI